ncbi:putative C-mannosyltransferase DPY19L1 [Acipenser ruthenus]|uniref:Putative C-mannosyltransferase DPY19L1 n=1 Tax=Acipenser ruthenus TaxID=7906 RepID=A0A444U413_ACIRT|nr:putative C-mannosyltransferase DPY19L1 [Acipenser ruthenus]
MAVKTRLQTYREHTQLQDNFADKARSPTAARNSSRLSSKRGVRDNKQVSSINNLIQNSKFAASIKSKLGLSPYAVIKIGITLIIGTIFLVFLKMTDTFLTFQPWKRRWLFVQKWYHISSLFENDRHFSHLSTLEKEMAFRTEMGLYYSYFKTIIEAPSFFNGLYMVMNDRLTEHPLVINTLKRFNLYPESTRVMWTPPLRENFSYPFLVLQMLLLTYILRSSRAGKAAFVALGVSNVFFMLPWQFAQFVLLTQMSLLVCFVLMFGNGMLLTSFYASSLVTIWGIIAIRTQISQFCKTAVLTCVAQGVGWFISTILLKFLSSVILGVSDDAHISNLIKSKFTSYKDFDTLMYTCAAEFDFMEKETPVKYLKTLLVPVILCVSVIIIEKLFGWIKWKYNHHGMVLVIIVVMSVQGFANLRNQWSIIGEFSNIPQEELLEWIKANTKPDDVFAGAMPTMASVKLSAERPVVNHPHYEDARLRATTRLVYSMYSRKTAEEVKWNLMKLQVDYFVLEDSWCTRRSRCTYDDPDLNIN